MKSRLVTRLAVLREHLGALGRERPFSAAIGMSASWLRKVSAGIVPLKPKAALQIQDKIGCSAVWLLDETGDLNELPVMRASSKKDRKRLADKAVRLYEAEVYQEMGIEEELRAVETLEGLPLGEHDATVRITLNSDLNQPSGKGVRIAAFVDSRRVTLDMTYEAFMEAMSGNVHTKACCEVKELKR